MKKIGESAFAHCKILKTIEFSEDSEICVIEKEAFIESGLTNFTVLPHVKTIEKGTFSQCQNLETINFSEDSELLSIESGVFSSSSEDSELIL